MTISTSVTLDSLGLRFQNGELDILDQRRLPQEEIWVRVTSPEHMTELITGLAVRGAPLIGVAAAMELARYALSLKDRFSWSSIIAAATLLRSARPTAVNLQWAIDRMVSERRTAEELLRTATAIFVEDVKMCDDMARFGAPLIDDGDGILTICNTGGLATVGAGTALGVIAQAWKQGRRVHVYFCETRPLLQGGRLTAWELQKLGIPHTLICDSMAATLLRHGKIQKCFVGADRVAANGDFANKIGTYSLAVLCQHHSVPFYPVAPLSTVDSDCSSGAAIPIEQRDASEVLGFGPYQWAPSACPVFNPAFDMTPANLVSGYILSSGFYTVDAFRSRVQLQSSELSC